MNWLKRTLYRMIDPKPVNTRHGVATPVQVKVKGDQVELVLLLD